MFVFRSCSFLREDIGGQWPNFTNDTSIASNLLDASIELYGFRCDVDVVGRDDDLKWRTRSKLPQRQIPGALSRPRSVTASVTTCNMHNRGAIFVSVVAQQSKPNIAVVVLDNDGDNPNVDSPHISFPFLRSTSAVLPLINPQRPIYHQVAYRSHN